MQSYLSRSLGHHKMSCWWPQLATQGSNVSSLTPDNGFQATNQNPRTKPHKRAQGEYVHIVLYTLSKYRTRFCSSSSHRSSQNQAGNPSHIKVFDIRLADTVHLNMPASTPNSNGSEDPAHVPHGAWDSFPWEPFPAYNGTKSIFYRSADNSVAVGAIREIGVGHMTWPEDEFLFVTKGWIKFEVKDGEKFTLKPGDVMFLKKGQTFDFEMSDDFANVAVFLSNEGVTIV